MFVERGTRLVDQFGTVWPVVGDEVKLGKYEPMGEWSDGVVTSVDRVHRKVGLALSSESSDETEATENVVVNFPDCQLIVYLPEEMGSQRNGGLPLYRPCDVAYDLAVEEISRDPTSLVGVYYADFFPVERPTCSECWGTVVACRAAGAWSEYEVCVWDIRYWILDI